MEATITTQEIRKETRGPQEPQEIVAEDPREVDGPCLEEEDHRDAQEVVAEDTQEEENHREEEEEIAEVAEENVSAIYMYFIRE
jgi:hypothetical protein